MWPGLCDRQDLVEPAIQQVDDAAAHCRQCLVFGHVEIVRRQPSPQRCGLFQSSCLVSFGCCDGAVTARP
jgi:hypothetical protein